MVTKYMAHNTLRDDTTPYTESWHTLGTIYKHPLQSYINIVYTF